MRTLWGILLAVSLATAARSGAGAEAGREGITDEENQCIACHGNPDVWEGETLRLFVKSTELAGDIHWQKGLRCNDCHGGNAKTTQVREAHATEDGFRSIKAADMPAFCGRCHSDNAYMRHYQPSPRIDQEKEYWTSGHGQRLQEAAEKHQKAVAEVQPGEEEPKFQNPGVATCLSCHTAGRRHHILAVKDQNSPVFPTHVAETCSKCHSDAKLMAGRTYHGRPLPHDQYENWKQSVHAEALLKKGDLSAATCNSCHGNHGALPPEVDSVANACGRCHGKVAGLFAKTAMKHRFETVGLPGCATCHSNHGIKHPSDAMLGMEQDAVCNRCHANNQHGATLAGAAAARKMRTDLEGLKQQIAVAEEKLDEAERLGMEVRKPRFDLRQARDALTNSRAQIHTFALQPFEAAVAEGRQVTERVQADAEGALEEYTHRRKWLAGSLVPIFLVVGLLLLYIRSLPIPPAKTGTPSH